MKSMTGFGRKDYRDEVVDCSIEIKTTNHRFRDFFIKIPRSLNPIEEKIRAVVSRDIARGRIEIHIKYVELGVRNHRIVFNRELANDYIRVLKEMAQLDPMIKEELSVSLISKLPDVIQIEEDMGDYEGVWEKMQPVLEKTLEEVKRSRLREGTALKKDMMSRRKNIQDQLQIIREKSQSMVGDYREALKEKVISYVGILEIDENRLLTEVLLMADKLSIDEEITRLQSHLEQLEKIVEEKEPVGRKLDFLMQEMNREINTIGSKACDLTLSSCVVDVKNEIEKIREQVQNIE